MAKRKALWTRTILTLGTLVSGASDRLARWAFWLVAQAHSAEDLLLEVSRCLASGQAMEAGQWTIVLERIARELYPEEPTLARRLARLAPSDPGFGENVRVLSTLTRTEDSAALIQRLHQVILTAQLERQGRTQEHTDGALSALGVALREAGARFSATEEEPKA